MSIQWNLRFSLLRLAALGTLALSACAAPTPAPTPTLPPTAAPTATPPVVFRDALGQPITAADYTDATHARLRVVLFDKDGPHIDFLVDGAVAVNGGVAQADIEPGYFTGYLYLAPGAYSVALAPAGQTVDQALVPPQAVAAEAGHRYTLVLTGQLADNTLQPLLIDETAEAAKLGAQAADTVFTLINNLAGAAGIDVTWDDQLINSAIPFGGFGAGRYAQIKAGGHVEVTGETATHLIPVLSDVEPGIDFLGGFTGNYPGADGSDYVWFQAGTTSELSIYDFLQGFSGQDLNIGGAPLSFENVLAAITAAGLTDLYTTGGPYILVAPTDEAFAGMPAADREALLADPAALTQFLLVRTVPAYLPRGGLSDPPGVAGFRGFTNLAGAKLSIGWTPGGSNGGGGFVTEGYSVNGTWLGDFDTYFVANGSVILPAFQVPFTQP